MRALHQLHGRAVDGTGRGKVDDGVDIGVFSHGLGDILVDRKEGLAGAPVHLTDELTAKGVDNTGDRGSGSLADEIEVEHALDSAGLHAAVLVNEVSSIGRFDILDEASCLVMEKGMGERREDTAGRTETGDVVVGGGHLIGTGLRNRARHSEN